MEKKFKRNIVKTGLFVCGALLLLCFLTFVALGIDIFAQSTATSTLMTVTGAFAFSLAGLTLITLILLIIQNASKRLSRSKGLSIAIFIFALFSTLASLAMLIVTLVLSNSTSNSSTEELLGALVGTSAQSGYIATIVIFGVLTYLEYWSAFVRENEEIELAYDDMVKDTKLNTILNNTNQNLFRISVPVIASQSCLSCHSGLKAGDIAGSVNASFIFNDTIAIFNVDLKSIIYCPYPHNLRFLLISSEIIFPSLNLTTRLQYSAISGS